MINPSEILFEKYCSLHNYNFEKIPEAIYRTPDYRITKDGLTCLVEIKELQANEDDKRIGFEMKTYGRSDESEIPGKRLRLILKDASNQLKFNHNDEFPKIILLYDNIRYKESRVRLPTYLFDQLDFAMYGDWAVEFKDDGSSLKYNQDKRGGNRRYTNNISTHVSAISVLYDFQEPTSIYTFHNYFAKNSLSYTFFSEGNSTHYYNEGNPLNGHCTWKKVI